MSKTFKKTTISMLFAILIVCISSALYIHSKAERTVLGSAPVVAADFGSGEIPIEGIASGTPKPYGIDMTTKPTGGALWSVRTGNAGYYTAPEDNTELMAGSNDNKVFYVEHQNISHRILKIDLKNKQSISGKKMILRAYFNITDEDESEANVPGRYMLYGDYEDISNHYYEITVRQSDQRQWIEIEIYGTALEALAANGWIETLYFEYFNYNLSLKPSRNGLIAFDEIRYEDVSSDIETLDSDCLTEFTQSTSTIIQPSAPLPAGISFGGLKQFVSYRALKDGAGDGYGVAVDVFSHAGSVKLSFTDTDGSKRSASVKDMDYITVRIYVNIDSDITSDKQIAGSYYLAADRSDVTNNMYQLKFNHNRQNQWMDLIIAGEDLKKLADESGEISALYFYYAAHTVTPALTGGCIYFDSIRFTESKDGKYPYLTTFTDSTVNSTTPGKPEAGLDVAAGLYNSMPLSQSGSMPSGSNDGYGFRATVYGTKYPFVSGTVGIAKMTFKSGVNIEDIDNISFKIYVDIDENITAGTQLSGKYYFTGDNADPYAYEIKVNHNMQKQWLYIVITGENLAKFADENGDINAVYFYYNTHSYTAPTGGIIYFDEVRYDSYQIEFVDGTEVLDAVKIPYSLAADKPVSLKKSGYVFAGWQTTDGNIYDFSTPVSKKLTLTAKWLEHNDSYSGEYTGLYKSAEGKTIEINSYGYINSGWLFKKDAYFETAKNGYIVAESEYSYAVMQYSNDTIMYDGAEYQKCDYYTVTYVIKTGRSFERFYEQNSFALNLETDEREGFVFKFWSQDKVEAFDFNAAITEEITLYSVWEYVLLEDYTSYLGTYYKTDGEIIILQGENSAKIYTGGSASNANYYVLITGAVVFEIDGDAVETGYSALYKKISFAGGHSYKKLGEYTVNFYSENTFISSQVINSGEYVLDNETAPAKEGYTFKGWKKLDGTYFDFDKTVTESFSVYADFEKSGGGNTEKGSSGCGTVLFFDSGSGTGTVLLSIVFLLAVCLLINGKKRVGQK